MRVSSIYSLVGIDLPPSSCASNSFITASEIALWPFCFLTHQAAALTDNPFRYASINRKLRLQNLLSVSVGLLKRGLLNLHHLTAVEECQIVPLPTHGSH